MLCCYSVARGGPTPTFLISLSHPWLLLQTIWQAKTPLVVALHQIQATYKITHPSKYSRIIWSISFIVSLFEPCINHLIWVLVRKQNKLHLFLWAFTQSLRSLEQGGWDTCRMWGGVARQQQWEWKLSTHAAGERERSHTHTHTSMVRICKNYFHLFVLKWTFSLVGKTNISRKKHLHSCGFHEFRSHCWKKIKL